jgi:hypothetical protein
MATVLGVDEVIGMLHDGNESDDMEDFEPVNVETKLKSRRKVLESKVLEITESIRSSEPGIQLDAELFKSSTVQFMEACLNVCCSFNTGDIAAALQTNISCGSVLQRESTLWLKLINRRISARQRIRNPFYAEIKRDLPFDVFKALELAVKRSSLAEFKEPNCYVSSNRKATVISLTSKDSVLQLFATLTGYHNTQVWNYFCKSLKSGKAKLIVTSVKDFGMIFKHSTGQFVISFNYGLWNSNGFPQHI